MIASRMNTIMPQLNEDEYIEVSKIYSFLGDINRTTSCLETDLFARHIIPSPTPRS